MPQTPTNVDATHPVSSRRRQYTRQKPRIEQNDSLIANCKTCGNSHVAKKEKCPVFGQTCHSCKTINSFKNVYSTHYQHAPKKTNYKKTVHELKVDNLPVYDDTFYVETIGFDMCVDTVNPSMAEH